MIRLLGTFSKNGILSKILLLIGFSCIFTVLGVIVLTLFGIGSGADVRSLKLMQLVQSVAMFVLPPILLAYVGSDKPTAFLHFNRKVNPIHIGLVVVFMMLIVPAINLLTSINQQLVLPKIFAGIEAQLKATELQLAKFTEQMLSVRTIGALGFNIFLIAIIPAFGEELFFRGAIQGIFRQKMSVRIAIWSTAVIFSAIHLQFYGFFPRMFIGAFFGYLLFWSESLWFPIVAHFTNNLLAILFYYLKYNGYKVPDIDTIGTGNTLWLGIVSTAIAILGIFWLKNKLKIRNEVVSEA